MDEAMEGLGELLSFNTEFNTTSFEIAKFISATILAVGLIFVVWALATKQDNAKKSLIAWVVCLIFTLGFLIKN